MFNTGNSRYYGDRYFAERVLQRCSTETLKSFFSHYGLYTVQEKDGRVYPVTYQSSSVLSALRKAISILHVDVLTETEIAEVCYEKPHFLSKSSERHTFQSDTVIIACGGAAQPKLGGSVNGYSILSSFGHRIYPVFPALVPVITDQKSISGLSGIRVYCSVSILHSGKILHCTRGELLFTDYGISGICVMQCARFLTEPGTYFEISFTDRVFNTDDEGLDELSRRRELFSALSPVSLLDGIVHERIAYAILKQAGIPLRGETAGEINDSQLICILKAASRYRIYALDTKGMDYAQVTAGGADCRQFDPDTMESRLIRHLYATGEVLNIDGDCGGFNLMFAFASGYTAGISC